ncbi:MAG: cytochrome c [Burkholderiales bacterium]
MTIRRAARGLRLAARLAGLALALALPAALPAAPDAGTSAVRGEYLVRAGGCVGCHTARGGLPLAGGRALATPFGTVYAPNLTPDARTGLGRWTREDFRRALREGRSKDGRLLYPAFPYVNYTRLAPDDIDAMFAYLRTLPAASNPNRPHALRFPYDAQWSLAAWRTRYFSPSAFVPSTDRSPAWNRGAYLVTVLGHCDACHGRRDMLGAIEPGQALAGGMIPAQPWYAPSLHDPSEGSVADWPIADIVAFLRTGVSARGAAIGPMAEVVMRSTQFLTDEDLAAMAEYLKALPVATAAPRESPPPTGKTASDAARRQYERHCADCHGREGEGARGAYPALAGNRTVTMANPTNLIRVVLVGAFAPATAGNPRPYGMPPFAQQLRDDEAAAILSFVRSAWGNRAGPVAPHEVGKLRGSGGE